MLTSTDLASRRILVTGASGFIGSHLCRRLLDVGARVEAVSRSRPSLAGLRWIQADLADLTVARRVVQETEPELVFHLCTHGRGVPRLDFVIPTFQSDAATTVNLLTALAEFGRPRIVITRSLEEPEGPEAPASPYAAGRVASAAYARLFQSVFDSDIVFPRIFMTYGPCQAREKLLPYLISSLLRGEIPRLGSGRRLVDWIYIDDVVDGLLAVAGARSGACCDLGSGQLISIRAFAECVAERIGRGIRPDFGALPERPSEAVRAANAAETFKLLHWRPRVPLAEGLDRTVEWYRNQIAKGSMAPAEANLQSSAASSS